MNSAPEVFSLTQIVGYVAYVITIAAFWQKNDKKLLLLNGTAAICWTLQYFMLGAWTGIATEILVVLRSFLSAFLVGQRHKNIAAAVFATAFIAAGIFTYHQPYDVLSVTSCLLGTISMVYLQSFQLRYGLLAATFLWTLYNGCAGTIGGALAGLTLMGIQIITLLRMYRDKRKLAA